MSTKKTLSSVLVSLLAASAFASGFSLYEPSAISTAMGNALVGKAMDASANFNNPATLTDLTNIVVSIGFITEHPRGNIRGKKNGQFLPGDFSMDPGMFWLPHLQLAVPLPFDFAFGLGLEPEYGLGTAFENSPITWNTKETTVQSFTLNPNLAYRITRKWSIGAGLRWMYFDFEQYKDKMNISAHGYDLGTMQYHLKGNNRCESIGWQIGTKYDILDNLSVGIVYKSPIPVSVRGDTDAQVTRVGPYSGALGPASDINKLAAARNGSADADLTLPQSVTAGFNWDITPKWHLGMALSWTEWSEFDYLVFNVQPQPTKINLHWQDTWRYSWGLAWDFDDDWTWMLSYTYDMDSTDSKQESTMLPPAARHIAGTGLTWRCWRGLEITVCYTCIFMHGNSMTCYDTNHDNDRYELEVCRGFCHAGGVSLTYRF